jgi:hypothetical protein
LTSRLVEVNDSDIGFRERNPDFLTALSLITEGTYTRLPTSLTKTFLPQTLLTNGLLLDTLQKLNRHLIYRLRCVDYLPPELSVEYVRDGRVRLVGGGRGGGWKVDVTVVGFGDDARWWLVGIEWGWRVKSKEVDDPGGSAEEEDGGSRKFVGEERQAILDIVNGEVLVPKPVLPDPTVSQASGRIESTTSRGTLKLDEADLQADTTLTAPTKGPVTEYAIDVESSSLAGTLTAVDAPLVRLYNFIRKSLPYLPLPVS